MPAREVNGASIYYECEGKGPALLLIHGLGSSGDDWAFQREEFARHFTLILPDLRGSGAGAKLIEALIQYARDVELRYLTVHSARDAVGFYEKLGFVHHEQWLALPDDRLR